ncbi:MAG: hypothetical protein J7598_12535 [Mitsuaria chitosanitabida]|uniref:hypothetical protein n=1 Tax=Roseateles chitosanitabidus TaxID=65048 RepID=UPI001B0D827A|nr:hypothetical protein [Roseateles chitosanitabidus]MBO9687428.1 hypothetical protein [Roseateles chitosanitabidus]
MAAAGQFGIGLGVASLLAALVLPSPVLGATEKGATTAAMTAVDAKASSAWVARMGEDLIPRRPADALLMLARREQPDITLLELTRRLALDLLLGEAARQEVGDEQLFSSRRVGFAPEVEWRRQWLATLQQVWPDRIDRAWRAASPDMPTSVDAKAWAALWSAPTSTGLRMDEDLDAAQRTEAGRLVLLRHRAYEDAAAGAITLADIWPLQNVQGRRLLRMGGIEFAQAQARQLLHERFIERWLRRESGWSAAELDFVRRAIEARQRKLAWERWQGLTADPHGDAPERDALAASVTTEEITGYYRAHPERFERLEAVEGLRLRGGEAGCGEGPGATAGDPTSLDRLAVDLRGTTGVTPVSWRAGDPAPVSALDAWSLDLSRAWPVGPASPPIRHPDGTGWERVQTLSVKRGLHPVDSETVRHEARQALALEKLERAWQQRQRKLLMSAGLVWAPGVTPPASPFEPALPIKSDEGHAHAH